jgi:hypothetical protein
MLEGPGLDFGQIAVAKRQEVEGKREGREEWEAWGERSEWGSHWRVGTMPFVLAPGALSSSSISVVEQKVGWGRGREGERERGREKERKGEQVNR